MENLAPLQSLAKILICLLTRKMSHNTKGSRINQRVLRKGMGAVGGTESWKPCGSSRTLN